MRAPRDATPHELGRWGEGVAARRLRADGWRILARSYRLGRREVDLIATRGEVIAFIEVKTRRCGRFGPPEEAVTPRKQAEIEAVATSYLARAPESAGSGSVRFDVVAIEVGRGGRIDRYDHLEDAWRPSR